MNQPLAFRASNFTINVLTATNWPLNSINSSCNLPDSVSALTKEFRDFYDAQHNGRKLTWLLDQGNSDVVGIFGSTKKDINMSTFCMSILVTCFNSPENAPISYADIEKTTGISSADLKRALRSLSLGKYRILTKMSKGKEIINEDTFIANLSFTCNLGKFKILSISPTKDSGLLTFEEAREREATMKTIVDDRKCQIEAVVVRIMKSRKTMLHNNLVCEVIAQLVARFNPEPTMVKQKIENLIDREFLERSAKDR